MIWSSQQSAIFDFYRAGKGNLIIEARAGTGKTTTVKEAFRHAPEQSILYAVFNKKNQKEAMEKITDPRVDVRTLHSLGYLFIKRFWRDAKPDNDVEFDRVKSLLMSHGLADNKELVVSMVQLIGFLKNTTINPSQAEAYEVAEKRDVLLGDSRLDEKLVTGALAAMELAKIKDERNRISFDDMVWLPVAMDWVYPKYELVTIDEAQDMNMPQLVMARQSTKGRVIVVGDSRQAIYGFRGAVQDAMDMMKITLRASRLGLTTTYRCPKSVVRIAAEIVPDYNAADTAPEGSVSNVSSDQLAKQVKFGDAILSRLNAPLMPKALSLIRANIPARIEGRDIAKQLLGMVRTLKANSVPDFMKRIQVWLDKQIQRLEKTKNADKKIEQAEDIAETLKALAQDAKGMGEVETRINTMFQDTDSTSKPCVILSSVHKAKGLEWNRVWLLSETFRKGKGMEEDNIYYVAVTRAKDSLFFVNGRASTNVEQLATAPTESSKSLINPVIQMTVSQNSARMAHDEIIVQGMIPQSVGNVITLEGVEYACHNVNDCNARFFSVTQPSKKITLSRQTESKYIVRRLTQDQINEIFHPRKAGAQTEDNNNSSEQNESENSMSTKVKSIKTAGKKASGAKTNQSQKGSAEFISMHFNQGTSKKDTAAKFLDRWPWMTAPIHFESRWNAAEARSKRAEKNGNKPTAKKAAKAPAKAPAKKSSPPPRKKAAKPIEATEAIPPRPDTEAAAV